MVRRFFAKSRPHWLEFAKPLRNSVLKSPERSLLPSSSAILSCSANLKFYIAFNFERRVIDVSEIETPEELKRTEIRPRSRDKGLDVAHYLTVLDDVCDK